MQKLSLIDERVYMNGPRKASEALKSPGAAGI